MKIWILNARNDLGDDDPWNPWYDKAFGFIVRAETEEQARQYAHSNAGDENRGSFLNKKIANTKTPWLESKYTTCEELTDSGDAGIIMRDFSAA